MATAPLTVDPREVATPDRVLRACATTAMEPMVCRGAPTSAGSAGRATGARFKWKGSAFDSGDAPSLRENLDKG